MKTVWILVATTLLPTLVCGQDQAATEETIEITRETFEQLNLEIERLYAEIADREREIERLRQQIEFRDITIEALSRSNAELYSLVPPRAMRQYQERSARELEALIDQLPPEIQSQLRESALQEEQTE